VFVKDTPTAAHHSPPTVLRWSVIDKRAVTIPNALVLVVCCLSLLGATYSLRFVWRADPSREVPSWWLWGGPSYRGFARAIPLGVVSSWPFLLAAFWGLGLITSMSASSTVSLLVLAALVIVGVGLMLSVALFNRPKSFVPPKLREQPGAWHEISAARRAQQR
jgi:hypothetical protein